LNLKPQQVIQSIVAASGLNIWTSMYATPTERLQQHQKIQILV